MTRRRSLYDKSAGQTETLTAILQVLFAVALGADMLAGGAVNALMTGVWAFVWEVFVLSLAAAALCAVAVLFASRIFKIILGIINGLISVLALCAGTVLAWAYCLGALNFGAGDAGQSTFLILLAGMHSMGFILFAFTMLCLALSAAYTLALSWHILSRNRDDFGRDYYTFVLTMRAKQAAFSLFLLNIAVGAMMGGLQKMEDMAVCQLFAFAGEYAVYANWLMLLFLPVAFACCSAMARSAVPMQRRTLAFLAVLMILLGMYILSLSITYC
jgi:hypothetical protein